jgi:hypothetical protein
MDSLDRIVGPATALLTRVDDVLSGSGAPPDHRVWAELRRVRLLPGAAVHAVATLRSADLCDAAPELRADARTYADVAGSLPAPGRWTGDAADAYDAARHRESERLSGTPVSLDERLEATADLADALIDWVTQTRGDLAEALAHILTSADALTLTADGPGDPAAPAPIVAAADVAERILHTVAESYDLAADLLHASAELATPLRA